MTKDYGEILLEAMSTLLAAATQPKAEDQEKEKTVEKINTADPLTNFLPNHSQTFNSGNVLWSNIEHKTSDNLLTVSCSVTTSKIDGHSGKITGSFGLTIALYSKDADKPYGIVFDSKQMVGNIYNFTNMPQRLILSIPNDMEVIAVSVKPYNNTTGLNFTVNSTTLSFGQDLNAIGATLEPFIITCADAQPKYPVTDRGTVIENSDAYYRLEARYVGKRANGNYYVLTPSNKIYLDTTNTSVRWYRHFPKGARADKVDNWGGAGWEYLGAELDGFELTCKPPEFFSAEHEVEKFKAVFVSMNLETGQPIVHTSNIIEITKEVVPTEGFINGMRLVLEDGTSGSYPFYESDGYIRPTLMAESAVERIVKCEYDTTYFDEDKNHSEDFFDFLDTIEWVYSPWSITSVILDSGTWNKQEFIDNNGYAHIVIDCQKPPASESSKKQTLTKEDLNKLCQFKYKIPAQRSSTALGTDKIECYIYFSDGKHYTASRGITLSQLGNSGTDYTIVTRLFSGSGRLAAAVPMRSNDLYYIECDVYDPEGKCLETTDYSLETSYPKVTITKDEKETITTETLTLSGTDNDTKSTKPMKRWLPEQLSEPLVIDVKVTLQVETSTAKTNNENSKSDTAVITRELTLQDTFIVPLCGSAYTNYVYRGASKVIYNSEGSKPAYDKSFLELLPNVANITWELSRSFKDASLNPEITKSGNNYTFTPVGMFDRKLENKNFLRIQAKSGKDIIWDQPIVFSQNKHFSAIIDGWDGSFQINEEGNYIMSSAYVAGGKDENNKFTGLVMGELGTIAATETKGVKTYANSHEVAPSPTETGLFGYREGAQSFGFRTDGTAFIGESGGGRINFDGNSGVIYSGNFDGFGVDDNGNSTVSAGTSGTYLNLTTGQLITSSGEFRGNLKVGEGQLAGWELDDKGLSRGVAFYEGDTQGHYAGLSSDTFYSILSSEIPFKYDISCNGMYYTRITGAKTLKFADPNNKTEKEKEQEKILSTWIIPAKIKGQPIKELLPSSNPESSFTWKDTHLRKVYFDPDVSLAIGANFFNDCESLEEVYIPKGVYRIGANAFPAKSTLQIYLEGEPNNNWEDNWWGGAATVYYSHSDKFLQQVEDYEPVLTAGQQEMVRFYAGSTSTTPKISDWATIRKDQKQSVFFVSDIGKAYMTDAEIRSINMSGKELNFGGEIFNAKSVFTLQSGGSLFIKGGQNTYFNVYNDQPLNFNTYQGKMDSSNPMMGGRINFNTKIFNSKADQLSLIADESKVLSYYSDDGITPASTRGQIILSIGTKYYDSEQGQEIQDTATLELDYFKLRKLIQILEEW